MTGAELLREGGWRQGRNPDGSEYWEHDAFRLVRYAPECALAQALELAHAEISHARPAIAALHEGANKLRAELAEANNRWHSACDVGRRLERRNAELMREVDEAERKAGR